MVGKLAAIVVGKLAGIVVGKLAGIVVGIVADIAAGIVVGIGHFYPCKSSMDRFFLICSTFSCNY